VGGKEWGKLEGKRSHSLALCAGLLNEPFPSRLTYDEGKKLSVIIRAIMSSFA
jgi:hypothetical protein